MFLFFSITKYWLRWSFSCCASVQRVAECKPKLATFLDEIWFPISQQQHLWTINSIQTFRLEAAAGETNWCQVSEKKNFCLICHRHWALFDSTEWKEELKRPKLSAQITFVLDAMRAAGLIRTCFATLVEAQCRYYKCTRNTTVPGP